MLKQFSCLKIENWIFPVLWIDTVIIYKFVSRLFATSGYGLFGIQ